jgi:hypothetical protein
VSLNQVIDEDYNVPLNSSEREAIANSRATEEEIEQCEALV